MISLNSLISELETDWKNILTNNLEIDILNQNISDEKKTYEPLINIFPPTELIFSAFNYFNFEDLKVVFIGQDVYHNQRNGTAEANGLCFSVPHNVPIPPSLRNILKEYHTDLDLPIPKHGNLEKWAQQGVLLLNCALTVREKKPGSHYKYWKNSTDYLIKYISENKTNIVYILLGNFAKNKKNLIDLNNNHIVEANHPSPLSANRGGFFGSKIFTKTNQILEQHKINKINWEL
jgi:uracil-DNA glycosylase